MTARRIAVDARPLCYPGTGIYRYTHELLTRLCRMGGEWFLYSHQRYDTAPFELANVHHRTAAMPPTMRGAQLAQLLFPLWARRDRVDVLWGPRHQLPPLMPKTLRMVLTIHDLVWKEYGETMRFPGRQIENYLTPRALARADVIAVVSLFTKSQLEKYFPSVAHKVELVPGASVLAGIDDVPAAGREENEGAYFLFVGTLEPRKNLPRLLRAYRRYAQDNPRARPLKIAGGAGWGKQDIAALLLELGLEGQVELLGRVDDSKLAVLYRGAHALLMPSLYEGFGLPVVEALSMGVPVITSRDSAMSEVAGSAGLYVDPASEADICQAITRISEEAELYDRLVRCIPLEIVRYEWDDSARKMAELLFQC